jgi:hypothetical protein
MRNILVSGAGIAGSTAAYWLADRVLRSRTDADARSRNCLDQSALSTSTSRPCARTSTAVSNVTRRTPRRRASVNKWAPEQRHFVDVNLRRVPAEPFLRIGLMAPHQRIRRCVR